MPEVMRKLYVDGHDELVRGGTIGGGITLRSLRDILAVGDAPTHADPVRRWCGDEDGVDQRAVAAVPRRRRAAASPRAANGSRRSRRGRSARRGGPARATRRVTVDIDGSGLPYLLASRAAKPDVEAAVVGADPLHASSALDHSGLIGAGPFLEIPASGLVSMPVPSGPCRVGHGVGGVRTVPVGHHLRDIARHVERTERARTLRKGADEATIPVVEVLPHASRVWSGLSFPTDTGGRRSHAPRTPIPPRSAAACSPTRNIRPRRSSSRSLRGWFCLSLLLPLQRPPVVGRLAFRPRRTRRTPRP